ncbi:hypothetical protein ZIOFF_035132 [Zingiber officinale]|uniref:TF-B3 domain-containing protein n=2 Tax=Zingiber officinale TaxID=94328 RepID=A0A8J5GJR7_ZINOF|nr:hypothetical protein ZIOFF_035132 [Zingiber officinale]
MMPNKKRKRCSVIRKPHFFKVLVGDFAHRLARRLSVALREIPQNFMKNISDQESRVAVLHGPGGGNWQVEVCSTGQEATLLLGPGWHSFVKDHSLEEFQFLVFRYDGEMHFTVLVFGMNGCERTDLFARKSPLEGDSVKVTTKDDHESTDVEIEKSTNVSARRVVTEEERSRAQKAANSFTSPHPYCVKRMNARNVYGNAALRLPARFSRVHLLWTRMKIVLRDPNGWAAFARGNNLEEGDYCVFELVKQTEMQVHIFRATQRVFPISGKRKMMGVLMTMAKHTNALIGPAVLLIYPLYASTRAIESPSPVDDQQWLTYWVLYSLITLFELSFWKVLQWFPLWPYMKLVFGFWLVFPAFNGAAYIYEKYVRSYVKQYVDWNYPEKQRRLMQLLSLDARKSVERYIDRYGQEAFRRVIENAEKEARSH